ncbi:hypothetical protein OXV74_30170, partial [Bacteroides thetaiotaomicron]|nr:hypothetical protein [Bacteroides thetaiotaomicron]
MHRQSFFRQQKKRQTVTEGICPRSRGLAFHVYKSDWRYFLTGRGLFSYPPPKDLFHPVLLRIKSVFLPPAVRQRVLNMLHG